MAIQRNTKSPVNRLLPEFGKGKYFLFSAFSFLLSCTILSLQLHSIWEWALGLSIFLVLCGLAFRSQVILLGSAFPILAAVLLTYSLNAIHQSQTQFAKHISSERTLTGTVVDLGNSKKWQQRATIEIPEYGKFYAKVPSQYSLLLGREISLGALTYQTGSLFESSRGVLGTVTYQSFEWGEVRTDYRLLGFKTLVIERIRSMFPHPESALLNGILVGDDSLMDEDFSTLYRTIGLSHITVVSGSNIAAILAVFLILLYRFPKSLRVGLSLLGILTYVFLVGMDPPVLRALVMGSLSLFVLTYGERADSVRILLFTAIVLVSLSPLSLVYDAGFQLSFLATLGILVSIRLFRHRHVILQACGVSVFAGIWTLPISIGSFWTFHLWSIPANILAGPAVEFSMFLGALALAVDTITPWWHVFGYLPYFTLGWIQKVAETFVTLPLQVVFPEFIRPILAFLVFGLTVGFSVRYLCLPDRSDGSCAPSGPR